MTARVSVAVLPTPLRAAPRLSDALGVEVWLKRDDLTGLGLGGNKARPLDYLLGDALAQSADWFVTGGGPRSNWVLMAALAALGRGFGVEVVLFGTEDAPNEGCLRLLRQLSGAKITFTGSPERSSVDPMLDVVASKLRSRGCRPYVVGRGGAGPVGALGYVDAVDEIGLQMEEQGKTAGTIWLATGSCGTQAGLVAGYRRPGYGGSAVVGVTVHRPVAECRQRIADISEAALDLLGVDARSAVRWEVLDGLCPDPGEVDEAAKLMMRTEGVFLDPEFGAPALSALIGDGRSLATEPVVFLVTGGAPALFGGGTPQ